MDRWTRAIDRQEISQKGVEEIRVARRTDRCMGDGQVWGEGKVIEKK